MAEPKDPKINCGRPLPPAEARWKPGQSGNPKGRPKKGNIIDVLRELVDSECSTDPERRTYAELLVRSLVVQGLKGNLRATKEVLNRLVGQAPFLIGRVDGEQKPPESSHRKSSLIPGTRARLSLAEKNVLEALGIEPLGDESGGNGPDTGS